MAFSSNNVSGSSFTVHTPCDKPKVNIFSEQTEAQDDVTLPEQCQSESFPKYSEVKVQSDSCQGTEDNETPWDSAEYLNSLKKTFSVLQKRSSSVSTNLIFEAVVCIFKVLKLFQYVVPEWSEYTGGTGISNLMYHRLSIQSSPSLAYLFSYYAAIDEIYSYVYATPHNMIFLNQDSNLSSHRSPNETIAKLDGSFEPNPNVLNVSLRLIKQKLVDTLSFLDMIRKQKVFFMLFDVTSSSPSSFSEATRDTKRSVPCFLPYRKESHASQEEKLVEDPTPMIENKDEKNSFMKEHMISKQSAQHEDYASTQAYRPMDYKYLVSSVNLDKLICCNDDLRHTATAKEIEFQSSSSKNPSRTSLMYDESRKQLPKEIHENLTQPARLSDTAGSISDEFYNMFLYLFDVTRSLLEESEAQNKELHHKSHEVLAKIPDEGDKEIQLTFLNTNPSQNLEAQQTLYRVGSLNQELESYQCSQHERAPGNTQIQPQTRSPLIQDCHSSSSSSGSSGLVAFKSTLTPNRKRSSVTRCLTCSTSPLKDHESLDDEEGATEMTPKGRWRKPEPKSNDSPRLVSCGVVSESLKQGVLKNPQETSTQTINQSTQLLYLSPHRCRAPLSSEFTLTQSLSLEPSVHNVPKEHSTSHQALSESLSPVFSENHQSTISSRTLSSPLTEKGYQSTSKERNQVVKHCKVFKAATDKKNYGASQNFHTPCHGVCWDPTHQRWVAHWSDSKTHQRIRKYFNPKILGFHKARLHAILTRKEAVDSGHASMMIRSDKPNRQSNSLQTSNNHGANDALKLPQNNMISTHGDSEIEPRTHHKRQKTQNSPLPKGLGVLSFLADPDDHKAQTNNKEAISEDTKHQTSANFSTPLETAPDYTPGVYFDENESTWYAHWKTEHSPHIQIKEFPVSLFLHHSHNNIQLAKELAKNAALRHREISLSPATAPVECIQPQDNALEGVSHSTSALAYEKIECSPFSNNSFLTFDKNSTGFVTSDFYNSTEGEQTLSSSNPSNILQVASCELSLLSKAGPL